MLACVQMTVGEGRNLQAVPLTKFQKLVRTAVSSVVPGSYKAKDTDQDYVEAYTEHYNCCPPPLFMIIISLVEVLFHIIYNGFCLILSCWFQQLFGCSLLTRCERV